MSARTGEEYITGLKEHPREVWMALSSYCKKLYECAVIKKLSVIFFLHAPLYFRPL